MMQISTKNTLSTCSYYSYCVSSSFYNNNRSCRWSSPPFPLSLSLSLSKCSFSPTASDSKSMAHKAAASKSNNININKWEQKTITLSAHPRGCHLITPKILKEIGKELSEFECGLAHFFLQHTSASLTINENYDTDVRHDTETFLNRVVPEGPSAPWQHTLEGPDDMPAHIKSSMFGCSLMIPISKGKLNMGTWQGIWLCEHRDLATPRKVVVTLNGI